MIWIKKNVHKKEAPSPIAARCKKKNAAASLYKRPSFATLKKHYKKSYASRAFFPFTHVLTGKLDRPS